MVKGIRFIESNYFDFDSAAIKSISRAVLDARAVPSIRGTASIEGHTDSVGGDRYNQLLSLRLAEAVEIISFRKRYRGYHAQRRPVR